MCNLPGTNARAVAELTLALMLAVLRRLPRFDAAMRRGEWLDPDIAGRHRRTWRPHGRPGRLRCGPASARAGAGRAGLPGDLHIARATSPTQSGEWRTLDALLAEADVVSLHLPLTPETENLIDAAALARMKPGAVLINTARGGLVDQAALTEALASGRLAGAGLDVFVHEPHDASEALFQLPNVVLTPHVAWLTTGTFDRSFALAAENCRRLAAGEALLHRVV